MSEEAIIEFGVMLQRLCTQYTVSIYPGYVDNDDVEEGIIVNMKGKLYALVDADSNHVQLEPLE